MQLAEITDNQSAALLSICYKDVKITLLLNLKEEKLLWRLIKITFKNIKSYLSEKEMSVFSFTFSSLRLKV